MRYVEHVTLATGHTRRSPRSEVADGVVQAMAFGLRRAVTGDRIDVPYVDDPPCTMTATGEGRCLIATVWGPEYEGQPVPLVTIGVATHARCGGPAWRLLHDHALLPSQTDRDRQPPVPWCAARLEPGVALHPSVAGWIGDYERCLAWAWIEVVSERRASR